MKLNEVLSIGGVRDMIMPSTFVNFQVVQPVTHQAQDPEQTDFNNKKVKDKVLQDKIDTKDYNKIADDQLKNYFSDSELEFANKELLTLVNNLGKKNEKNEKNDKSK